MIGAPTFGGRARTRRQLPDGNALRAAVLGANDGLVSNFGLVMGVAGAGATREPLLVALGAAIPLLPFLVANGPPAAIASAVVAGAMLFVLGAGITMLTGRHPVLAGVRQLGFGMAAATITFGIGSLLGTVVA